MQRRELENHLRSQGCRLHHHGRRHDVWLNPATGEQEAIPRHNEINQYTARAICRGLKVSDLKR
jgi:hypothetical protein